MGKGVYQRIGVFGMDLKRNNRVIEKALLKKKVFGMVFKSVFLYGKMGGNTRFFKE